jgi:hypothetical protein
MEERNYHQGEIPPLIHVESFKLPQWLLPLIHTETIAITSISSVSDYESWVCVIVIYFLSFCFLSFNYYAYCPQIHSL